MGLAIGAFNVHVPAMGADALPRQEDQFTIKTFVRYYTVNRLRERTFHRLADALTDFAEPSLAYEALNQRCFKLSEEKREEFEDICNQLNIDGNLEEMYRSIVVQIFSDAVNLGRILAFAAFSAELIVHCALLGREDRAIEVANWVTDVVAQWRLDQWVHDQGGWYSVSSQSSNDQSGSDVGTVVIIATALAAVISVVATSVLIVKNST